MANNNYKHKDYSNLLRELQKKQSKQNKTVSDEKSSDTVKETVSAENKGIDIDYDLDNLLYAVNGFSDLVKLYEYCTEMIEREQQITQDLLHAIEFSDNYKERYKLSTQLHYNRKRRREYKNAVAVLQPLIEFVQKDDTKKCLNKLSNLIGESRKVKSHGADKSYSPRILTELGVLKNEK